MGDSERFSSPSPQNEGMGKHGISAKIGGTYHVGHATVERAADFTFAVDKIVANTFYCALLP